MKKVIIAILIILAAALSISAYQNNPKTIINKIGIWNRTVILIFKRFFLFIMQ